MEIDYHRSLIDDDTQSLIINSDLNYHIKGALYMYN